MRIISAPTPPANYNIHLENMPCNGKLQISDKIYDTNSYLSWNKLHNSS